MKTVAYVVGALILGIVIGMVAPSLLTAKVSTSWVQLTPGQHHFGESFATEVAFADLPSPDFVTFSGKAKFLEPAQPGGMTRLGYVLNFETKPVDMAKVPQKYKEEKKELINGQEITVLPIEVVYHSMVPHFKLIDKDDFVLKELDGKAGAIESGKAQTIQDISPTDVPYDIAVKVKRIAVGPDIEKCETCGR